MNNELLMRVFTEAQTVVKADEEYQECIRSRGADTIRRAEEDLFAMLVRLGNAVHACEAEL
jgi:hypothetical protein